MINPNVRNSASWGAKRPFEVVFEAGGLEVHGGLDVVGEVVTRQDAVWRTDGATTRQPRATPWELGCIEPSPP